MKLFIRTKEEVERTVAPRRGAWIETGFRPVTAQQFPSPPAGGRGLKLNQLSKLLEFFLVAPRRGAWIETVYLGVKVKVPESPPAGGRGLKLYIWA